LVTKDIWKQRFEDIRNVEQYLSHNGIMIRKIFLNVSKKEQKRRFLDRIDDPLKNWKFSSADAGERDYWDDYMAAYEDLIKHTSSKEAPWHVIPADNKWFTRVAVAAVVIDALADLNLEYPKVDEAKLKDLAAAREKLTKGRKAETG
jgi:polyphosphate kinase 2 (PPK2 family)